LYERLKDPQSVGRAEQSFDRPFGVRHQTHHVALLVDDTGDVVHRTVRIARRRRLTRHIYVPETDTVVRFQCIEDGLVSDVVAFAMRNVQLEDLAGLARVRECRRVILDPDSNALTEELERTIANECAGQQAGFAQDLETVAYTEQAAATS
jgi:hypothetical protein